MFKRIVVASLALMVVASCSKERASATHWTGGGDGINWSDADNWQPSSVPNADTAIVIQKASVRLDADTTISSSQRLMMIEAVLQIAPGTALINAGVIDMQSSTVAEVGTGVFQNDGSVVGEGTLSIGCGGGAAPDTGEVANSIFQAICATPCDPTLGCCEPGAPTGCTHTVLYWEREADWPLAKTELICGRQYDAVLRSDDFGDLESDSGSDSDPCSDSSESASSSSESASNSSTPGVSSDSGSISSNSDSFSDGDQAEAWFQLAHSYIAAVINQASGASSTPRVDLALEEARILLTMNCSGIAVADLSTVRELDVVLTDYNTGVIGPGPCAEEPVLCAPTHNTVAATRKEVCFDTGYGKKCMMTSGLGVR